MATESLLALQLKVTVTLRIWCSTEGSQQMVIQLNPPLRPRYGAILWVLLICRVSDPREGKQDERSLDDQEAMLRRWLSQHTDCQVEVDVIAGDGSGERLDRPEVLQAQQAVASGKYDLVLTEDLGRFLRQIHALLFCELCEDRVTRLFAINDNLDTAQPGWRMSAIFASFRHEQHNADASQRIRRTLRNRHMQGGALRLPKFGYVVPPGCKSDLDVRKIPDAEPIVDEWFARLEAGDTFATVADWLNNDEFRAKKILPDPDNPYKEWDVDSVARITRNEILKGVRVRNNRMSKRVNETGRRKSIKAPPEDRLERQCPPPRVY